MKPMMLHYLTGMCHLKFHTDASSKAVAAILCQNIEGMAESAHVRIQNPIGENEQKYHIYDQQQTFAVVMGCGSFRKYIRNRKLL